MLRTRQPTRILGVDDVDDALDLCARDPAAHVFVASRILDGGLGYGSTAAHGWFSQGRLEAFVWTLANVVPVGTDVVSWGPLAAQVHKVRRRCASFLGPREEVLGLWSETGTTFPNPRSLRSEQPLMATRTPPSRLGFAIDERVRRATLDEVDLVLPAAEHMFTHEIGYRPYTGSVAFYRDSIRRLIVQGRTYVVIEGRRVVFKADIGSVALDTCQIQGVWLAPELRGQGLAAGFMASVVEQAMADHAPLATLYVNDFNVAAMATYERIGMERVGTFATILF
ncbi:GNAT family N-acetyltransferase [Janibacter sp. GS2]|uniref:GNAT family N-acetyltransferase n=1 Tax=Janibacter sp. GS2 TaxID=3442646 RepID=UPI003EBBB056